MNPFYPTLIFWLPETFSWLSPMILTYTNIILCLSSLTNLWNSTMPYSSKIITSTLARITSSTESTVRLFCTRRPLILISWRFISITFAFTSLKALVLTLAALSTCISGMRLLYLFFLSAWILSGFTLYYLWRVSVGSDLFLDFSDDGLDDKQPPISVYE